MPYGGFSWGNRCGHEKDRPWLGTRRTFENKRPPFLALVISRVQRFYWDPSILPTLAHGPSGLRQLRSERREAIVRFVVSCINRMEICSRRVGAPGPTGLFVFDMATIATDAGLSEERCWEAQRLLRDAGLMNIKARCRQTESGGFLGAASVRQFTPAFFSGLRLAHDYTHAAKRARRRLDRIARDEGLRLADLLVARVGGHRPNRTSRETRKNSPDPLKSWLESLGRRQAEVQTRAATIRRDSSVPIGRLEAYQRAARDFGLRPPALPPTQTDHSEALARWHNSIPLDVRQRWVPEVVALMERGLSRPEAYAALAQKWGVRAPPRQPSSDS